jgi:predicted ATPase
MVAPIRTGAPFLHDVVSLPEKVDSTRYPFNLPAFSNGIALTQFLIATHSPIILSYPGAVLFSLDGDDIREVNYRDTKHFLITRDFLNSPESFFKHLFSIDDENPGDT